MTTNIFLQERRHVECLPRRVHTRYPRFPPGHSPWEKSPKIKSLSRSSIITKKRICDGANPVVSVLYTFAPSSRQKEITYRSSSRANYPRNEKKCHLHWSEINERKIPKRLFFTSPKTCVCVFCSSNRKSTA